MPNKITCRFWRRVLIILMKIMPYNRTRLEEYVEMIDKYEGKDDRFKLC